MKIKIYLDIFLKKFTISSREVVSGVQRVPIHWQGSVGPPGDLVSRLSPTYAELPLQIAVIYIRGFLQPTRWPTSLRFIANGPFWRPWGPSSKLEPTSRAPWPDTPVLKNPSCVYAPPPKKKWSWNRHLLHFFKVDHPMHNAKLGKVTELGAKKSGRS